MTDGGVYDNSATSWYRDLEIPFQIRQLQEIDKFSRQEIDKAQRAMTAASQYEAKATSVLSERDPADQELIKQSIKRVKELETQVDVGRLKKQVLTNPPEVVQSLLDEFEDTSYDLIAVNASYPPKSQHADLVARPVLSDMFIFTKCTETLYNNANHQRLRDLRRVFLNKQMTGALVSFEENPQQLASYLADPQQWLLGKVPEEQDQLLRYFYDPTTWSDEESSEDGIGAILRRRVAEIKSFYTRLEYSPDNISIPAPITNRGWEVIEQFHPGYQKAPLPSADELRKLKELCDTRERLQQEVKARETVRDAIEDQLVGAQDVREAFKLLREKNSEVLEAKRSLSETKSELRELAMAVFQRRFTADLDALPVILGLNAIRTKNQNVATTLGPLGLEKTANLLYQGYLCAMMNLHVLLDGYPLMPLPEVQDFKDLASGRWETWGSRQPATTKSEGAAF